MYTSCFYNIYSIYSIIYLYQYGINYYITITIFKFCRNCNRLLLAKSSLEM